MIETLSPSLKFESFEMEGIDETPDMIESRQALINKHGLTGQKSLIAVPDRPLTFRLMTADEQRIYSILCPKQTKHTEYDGDPIPLRALELLDKAASSNVLTHFKVWHPEVVKDDPVLVGYTASDIHGAKPYLIARWGVHLDEWPALVKLAREAAMLKLRTILADVTAKLARTESCPVSEIPSTSYYWAN